MVMTDWRTRAEHLRELPAGNGLKMTGGYPGRIRAAMELGLVFRSDLEACTRRVLELILKAGWLAF